jgi:hypothetical protein
LFWRCTIATNLTVNNNTFPYPESGDEPGWGGPATDWAVEVTGVLNTLQGVDDIPETTFNLANNTVTPQDVVGLVFNPATVRSAVVDYSIYRSTTTTELAEKGKLELIYKNGGNPGEKWTIGRVFFGDDAGITITMTDGGQAQYVSSNLGGSSYVGQMKFEAVVTQQ